jgi:multicomponent Na+:H+ antiporter subunit D
MSLEFTLLAVLLLPLIGALTISRIYTYANLRESISLIVATALLLLNIALYNGLDSATHLYLKVAEPITGLVIAFSIDSLGVMFAIIASSLWIVTSIYSIGYMRAHQESHQTRFYSLFAIAIGGVMAVAYAENLFTLFVFYELLTVSTYPLVTHAGTDHAKKGGRRYLTILMGSSIAFFLPAIVICWHYAGNLSFRQGGILAGTLPPDFIIPLTLLFLFGISKAGLMPLHRWLPSAMVAPTPVSALLHAVAVVKAGVFSLYKVIVFIIGPEFLFSIDSAQYLVFVPLATMLLASLVAMTKDNLKERLAYSTISQLSYIVLGILLANKASLMGSGLHIAMHATAKITLFFAAGAILITAHKTRVSELIGLGRTMPITFSFFTIASLSIIGLPLFGGLWSKWFLIEGAVTAHISPLIQYLIIGCLLLSSLLNISYLLSIPMRGFFATNTRTQAIKEAPNLCLLGMAIPALACIYLFFQPTFFYDLMLSVIAGVTR